MEPIEQTDDFRRAYQFASETNRCVFITGKAGTGKTTLLKYIRENCFKQISVLAPTGVAAINAGGSTIHSFFQLPFSPFLPPANKTFSSEESKNLLATIKLNNTRRNIMRQLDLLIIDEISMVRCDILDAIDVVLRSVRRRNDLPFGGVQVIMVGDMYQLPPVVREDDWVILREKYKSPFFFDSDVVNEVKPVYIELEKIYRQDEPVFIDLLNKVRNNIIDDASINLLNNRYKNADEIGSNAIILTTHNYMADTINAKELANLPTKEKIYPATVQGIFPEKSYPAEVQLKLKTGARVMFIKNDPGKRFFNGKTGIIKSLDEESVSVRCEGESYDIMIGPEAWTNIQYKLNKETNKIEEETLGEFVQFPLRLAWAVTIHKSQGLTFDKVVIDAAQAFSSGQVYVALSRCRSLEGIILKSHINQQSLTNDAQIVSFAATRTPQDQVTKALTEDRRNYIQNILFDIFNISGLETDLQFLDRKLHELQKQFVKPDPVWINGMANRIKALAGVASKFQNELQLLTANESGLLNERVRKASIYFKEKLTDIRKELLLCPWVTESIMAAKEITVLLDEMFSLLSYKIFILDACQENFDLHAYTKQRQLYKLPENKFRIYAAEKKQKETSGIPHPPLFMALQQLRDDICSEQNRPIYMVANRNTLLELCERLPNTKEGLLKISGFGKAKADTIGPRFLQIITEYMEENGFESNIEFTIRKKKEPKPVKDREIKIPSEQQSFDLFQSGKTIEEIAAIRNIVIGTVQSHLISFIGKGEIPLNRMVSEEKINELTSVLQEFPEFNSLTELKQRCSEQITFNDIRSFLAFKALTKKPVTEQ